ncbi:tetratricopeptide repeat protein [Candidatus Thioglobus sp.]|nr:tetratricopeptide repeat protein [Candidatus Thioglobus sp.]
MPSNNIDSIIALFSSGSFQDALNAIEELIEDNSNDALLFNIRGACYAALDQKNLAIENYEKAIKLNPGYAKAHYNLAGVLHELNDIDASIQSYQNALLIDSDYAEAHNNLGNVFKEQGQFDAAIKSYKKAIAVNPDYIEAYYSLGGSFYESEKLENTVQCYEKVIELKPNFTGMHNNLGNILRELGRLDAAVLSYENAIRIDSDFVEVYYNLGITYQELNQLNDSIKHYKKAIELQSNYPEAFNNLGIIYKELEEFDLAIHSFNQAIGLNPKYAEAYNNLGILYRDLGKADKAFESYKEALKILPDYDEAHNNLGILFMDFGQIDRAIDSYQNAIQANEDFIEAINNLGIALMDLGEIDQSINYYHKAISIDPKFALTYNNLGIAYKRNKNLDAALKCLEKAIALDPKYTDAFSNYGNLLTTMDNFEEAQNKYQSAYEIDPNINYILGNLIHTKMHLCIWDDFSKNLSKLKNQINAGQKRIDAFSFMALIDDPKLQKKVSKIYSNDKFPKSDLLPQIKHYPKHKKIRIGYFSGDFREHPVSTLTAGLYENHDRDFFEIHAFSYGPDTNDEMNLRIKAGVDYFHEVQMKPHKDIALLSRSLEIDIAVDLGGYTAGAKTDIFAMSAAPIQLSYIGFLGTMGADYYDYLISDITIIPEDSQKYYSEKIIYLPYFQANDSKQTYSIRNYSREDIGLPEKGFVFCCFNNTYKFTPSSFDSWCRILKAVNNSVLLLYASNKAAEKNLTKEIAQRGIDSKRIIFGEHLPLEEYLGRYRVVDLFLDTNPYNAGTTSSDAMRMGLPVITLQGKSFSSRMGASILKAINMPELIASNQNEYESMAIELATNSKKMKEVKEKLSNNIKTAPLFNTALFTKHLESAYKTIYERHHDGLRPEHIYVE